MIIEYHRPENLEQAKRLLNRKSPITVPMGGGTVISRYNEKPLAVVDLQALGLNKITFDSDRCHMGSMVRLQDIVEYPGMSTGLAKAARRETNINLRRVATVGGALMTGDGKSPFLGCLLALDVGVFWESGTKPVSLNDWMSSDRLKSPGKLITGIDFSVPHESDYEDIARSPEDKPIVFVNYAKWKTGDIRIVYGGSGTRPILHTGGSPNIVKEIFNRVTRSSTTDGFSTYTDYQQSALKILIDRIIPGNGNMNEKDIP